MSSFTLNMPEKQRPKKQRPERTQHKKGEVVWPFRIKRVLGGGAMGDVYLAEHITDGELVALKFIPESLKDNKVLSARFRREMLVLQQLRHPSIVRFLSNLNEEDDEEPPYYAMEFVGGGTLADLLRVRVRLSSEETFHYAVQILGALSAAHKHGVIHRDVKPSNLLISKDRRALKLCDFGLAMVLGGTQLTQHGQTIGTPWYMSPEQIRGEDRITAATDLYAVGAILMEALTGKPPFVGDTHFSILNQHLSDEPPLVSSRVPNLANISFVDRFVSQLLEKDPARRPHNAGDLIADIGNTFRLPELRHAAVPEDRNTRQRPVRRKQRGNSDSGSSPKATTPARVAWARTADFWQRLRTGNRSALILALAASLTLNVVLLFSDRGSMSRSEMTWIEEIPDRSVPIRRIAPPFLAILSRSEPEALNSLIDLLDAEEPEVRSNALFAISQLGQGAEQFRSRVQSMTRDESAVVRESAERTLQCIDEGPPPDWLRFFPE